jgi:hypothetical protein
MKVDVLSLVEYCGRYLAIVVCEPEAGVETRLGMYFSTGRNSGHRAWFPFAGLQGKGMLWDAEMHPGWISKALVVSKKEGVKLFQDTSENHRSIEDKLNYPQADIDLRLINDELMKIGPTHVFASGLENDEKDILFINQWFRKGVKVV